MKKNTEYVLSCFAIAICVGACSSGCTRAPAASPVEGNSSAVTQASYLVERIEKLESELKELRTRFADAAAPSKSIRMQQIQITDTNDNVRMVLGAMSNGAVGLFAPDASSPLLAVGISPAGQPAIELTDKTGSHRATLSSLADYAQLLLVSRDAVSLDMRASRELGIVGMKIPGSSPSVAALQVSRENAGLTVARDGNQVMVSGNREGAGLFATGKDGSGNINNLATISFIPGKGAGIDLRDDEGRRNGMTTASR